MKIYVRQMVRIDLPCVLEIDDTSFEERWSEEDFLTHLRERSIIGMVAECGDRVVGYMVYQMRKSEYEILRIAVAPDCRRRGIGFALLCKMADKLSRNHRTRFHLAVSDRNLVAQLWLQGCGLKAIGVEVDMYRFEFRVEIPAEATCD
jgi:ribosomal-protein-alanine N-acetyltransferase